MTVERKGRVMVGNGGGKKEKTKAYLMYLEPN